MDGAKSASEAAEAGQTDKTSAEKLKISKAAPWRPVQKLREGKHARAVAQISS